MLGALPAGILTARAPSSEAAAMRVWPALPAPGELVRLPLPCPPQLIELSGYTGGARLVALWWSPFGDELMISDGTLTETGRWRGWLCFLSAPAGARVPRALPAGRLRR